MEREARTLWAGYVLIGALLLSLTGCGGGSSSSSNESRTVPSSPAPEPSPQPAPPPETFSIEGQLLADPIFEVDSDTNDLSQVRRSNSSFASAQTIKAGAEVRGYINCRLTAAGDVCTASSDEFDVYRVELKAGEVVALDISDYSPQTAQELDLDLYLYDLDFEEVASSFEFSARVEQITVTEDGTYFVVPTAYIGGSNYALTITEGATTPPQPASTVYFDRLAAERVTVVEPDDPAVQSRFRSIGVRRREMFASSRDGRSYARHMDVTEEKLDARGSGPLSSEFTERVFGARPGTARDPSRNRKLALLSEIKRINHAAGKTVVRPYHYPTMHFAGPPPRPDIQWNLGAVGWQEALTLVENTVGPTRRPLIAVLDSGVISDHPKIAPVLTDARDFVPRYIDGDGFDDEAEEMPLPDDPNPEECFNFHGTHVASVATAPREGGVIDGFTMVGGLPFADLMAIKLGYSRDPQCRQILGDIPGAIRYAAGLENSSGSLPPRRADVINLSFGSPDPDLPTRQAIADAVAAGVIVVASAGNEGAESAAPPPNYPASYPDVIAVAATDLADRRAPYSSFYPQVEVAAPGGNLAADVNGDDLGDGIAGGVGFLNDAETEFESGYILYQGTSMAAPMVSAGVALMKAVYPELTSDDMHALLEAGRLTTDIEEPGRDAETGFGLISFLKMAETAIELRGEAIEIPADFRLDPAEITFGNIETEAVITVSSVGSPDFKVSEVAFTGRDLSTNATLPPTALEVGPDGFGTYRVAIDRSRIFPGEYVAQVTVTISTGESKLIPVTFRVPETSLTAGTAPAEVLLQLETAGGFRTVGELTVPRGAGGAFRLEGIEPGTYRLLFTTDMDNDGQVCDAGELGGSFPGRNCDSTEIFSIPEQLPDLIDAVLRRIDES